MEYTKISSYKLTSQIRGIGAPHPPDHARFILLTSEMLFHGIVVEVTLFFSSAWDGWSGELIGFSNNSDLYAPKVWIWLRLSEYQFYYDIVRQEKPVYFGYNPSNRYSFPDGSFYIDEFQLITNEEPTGEGGSERMPLRPVLRLERIITTPDQVQELLSRHQESTGA